ncbi:hypothetical protein CCACVL1_09881 [Corchorus capsularis]|uniref:non-specific serine/threonine protein kinase n=1 Tax=Corchorus capsularis TaxID=210143 RepID=A0A1R3ITT7_COCAP|nr:hypothetical protein CCACVL1_09881 [Corchorus capsularis]
MAVAKSNSFTETSKQPCNCYKLASLSETILETDQTANLKDRYILGEQLGWGQFGVIRLCSDKVTSEVLACKSISKDRLVTSDDARSVKLEIEIMTRLSGHPNVVDLKAVYEDEDYVHLVMELCAGGELFHRLEKYGRFPETEARVLFRHLMQVVLYCHEIGVVHRDLKPENILLATKASSSPIKLADFGLATYIEPGQCLHGTVGSPFYIAPEVLKGGYNQAADVWSAGVILYILLTGTPPFWGKTKSRIFDAVRAADLQFPSDPWNRISDSAKNLVRGMLNTDPCQRLTALQVLDHIWMRNDECCHEQSSELVYESCAEWEFGSGSFSLSRDQDISFGAGSPIICDVQTPTATCRTSFSSFLVEPSTPCLASGGFSFCSANSDTLEFSSPIPSMPSFAFFGASSLVEKENCRQDFTTDITGTETIHADAGFDKLIVLPDSSPCCGPEAREMENKAAEFRRTGGSSGARMLAFHSKRNRTIGHIGEREQLDFMVSESVIRWASCEAVSTTKSIETQQPKTDVLTVSFKTLGACKLGISRYPDFEYNAQGGTGAGTGSKTKAGNEISVNFDIKTLYIPPLSSATTKFLGLPLPPLLKIDIVPQLFQGNINQESGKVDLEFLANFCFSVGSIYRAPPLLVKTVLTSEESKGKIRSGRGERLDGEGNCKLVGVATVDPIDDFFMNTFLSLPTECLAKLNAVITVSDSA